VIISRYDFTSSISADLVDKEEFERTPLLRQILTSFLPFGSRFIFSAECKRNISDQHLYCPLDACAFHSYCKILQRIAVDINSSKLIRECRYVDIEFEFHWRKKNPSLIPPSISFQAMIQNLRYLTSAMMSLRYFKGKYLCTLQFLWKPCTLPFSPRWYSSSVKYVIPNSTADFRFGGPICLVWSSRSDPQSYVLW